MSEARIRKRATIQDVAHLAGASRGVVSSVLNGNRHVTTRVSPDTQERIRKAAASLGYRPNALARSLQRRQTQTILFASYFVSALLNTRGGGFYVEVLDGALTAATRRGYDLTIHLVHQNDPEKAAVLGDGRADGCIWIAPIVEDPIIPRLGRDLDWPLVVFGGRLAGATANVIADNFQAMELAVEHLYSLGHRRLAFVNQNNVSYECVERWEAFADACARYGLPARQIIAAQTEPDANGRRQIKAESIMAPLLDQDSRPTGIVAFNDSLASAVMEYAHQIGLVTPRDLSVIGFDSTPLCDSYTPPLTSLRQPLGTMAERCVEILIQEINAEEINVEEIKSAESAGPLGDTPGSDIRIEQFACRLDIRASTAPAPSKAPLKS
jgi:LacI family transcriptional regulator